MLSGNKRNEFGVLELTHPTNEDDLTVEQKENKFYRMMYGFNSAKSPKHTIREILAAGKINKTFQKQEFELNKDSSLELIKSRESA